MRLLGRAGYARYDYRTALRLKKLAATLHGHRIAALGTGSSSGRRSALDALPGWGPVTVALFLRELRGVWPDVDPPVDDRAEEAAHHLGLLDASDQPLGRLRGVATQAGLDLRDLGRPAILGIARREAGHGDSRSGVSPAAGRPST